MKNTNQDWLIHIKGLVGAERECLISILHALDEIDRRRKYAEIAYSTLTDFCRRELKYSEPAAYRRISAMKVLRDLPDLEPLVRNGDLSLTTIMSAHTFFQRQQRDHSRVFTQGEKRAVYERLKNCSRRECDKLLLSLAPEQPLPQEFARVVTPTDTEIRFVANDELWEKLQKIRELTAHVNPKWDYSGLINYLADVALKRLDPALNGTHRRRQKPSNPRRVSAALKNRVWLESGGQCSWVDQLTGRRCETRFGLQVDHIVPFAKGGVTELGNLRLLCRAHNQIRAVEEYGRDKMKQFIPHLA